MHNYKKRPNEVDFPLDIGTPVEFTASNVKWHLDHLEVYRKPNGKYSDETEIKLYMYSSMFDTPITGVVVGYGAMNNTYRIRFGIEGIGSSEAYYEAKKDFKLNKLYAAIAKR